MSKLDNLCEICNGTCSLTEKQSLFIRYYTESLNGTQAALSAGYSEKTARSQASQMMDNLNISKHLKALLTFRKKTVEITAENVLRELAAIGFARMDHFLEPTDPEAAERLDPEDYDNIKEFRKAYREAQNGLKMKGFEEMGESVAAITEINFSSGGIVEIKTKDKVKSLLSIGKHIGMFNYEPENAPRDRSANNGRILEALRGISASRAKRKGKGEKE